MQASIFDSSLHALAAFLNRRIWQADNCQSWTASAYLRMILFGVVGLRISSAGVSFQPCLPDSMEKLQMNALPYRGEILNLTLEGHGTTIRAFSINGVNTEPFLPAGIQGEQEIVIRIA